MDKKTFKNFRRNAGGKKGHKSSGGHFKKNDRRENFPKRENYFNDIKESQVGITEFISDTKGFSGIMKSRFSDFHVNEIDTNNKALQLTELNIPKQENCGEDMTSEESIKIREDLADIITPDMWSRITELAESKGGSPSDQPINVDVQNLDKETRTKIHTVLKKLYKGNVVSTTIEQKADAASGTTEQESQESPESGKFISIMKPKSGKNFNRWNFPGEYVHFLVHKENVDTVELAGILADKLKLPVSHVNYCGTKDKRGKTTQKFCIKRRSPSQIVGAVKTIQNVKVGNFEFSKTTLKLGDLLGNRFRIALRHINGDKDEIEEALKQLRTKGFINYFGLQRFGKSASVPTYEIGIALSKSDYKLACELILKPRDNDLPWLNAIREKWWKDRDSAAAVAMFRNDKFLEKRILDGLAMYGDNDYAAALRKIPRNMLLLYLHAFQSLIFNKIASRRIKEFGLEPIEGDLVYRENVNADIENQEEDFVSDILENDMGSNDLTESETELVTKDDSKKQDENILESEFKRKVKPLQASDIASGQYTLFDVVLPLPGFDVTYPSNVVGSWYEEILGEYGLTSEKLRHNVKTYSLTGAYRKLIIKPENLSWEFCSYDDSKSALIASDWEILRAKDGADPIPKLPTDGEYRALLLDFCLPTSAYATMMLRELLKSDTSSSNQAHLEQCEMKKIEEKANELNASTDDSKISDEEIRKRKTLPEDDSNVEVKVAKLDTEMEEIKE